MKAVSLQHITKSYDNKHEVLQDISVTIEPGEFFVLVGPSGCGKSTMLRMIAGLETITSGQLLIGEQVANDLPPVKRELSMVFQNYALYPHLSVAQNISFGLHAKKMNKKEINTRIEQVAATLQLTPYLQRKPRELSGGQRQRVALARAIVSEAPICLMDEPLSNLDAKLRTHMRAEIKKLQRQLGITMIYVTHDQVEAMTMGDRIMILHNGEIQQIGRPIDIYNYPANPFVATFIGAPPMNIAQATVTKQQLIIEDTWQLPYHLPSKLPNVKIGIRPEHIYPPDTIQQGFATTILVENVEMLGTETIIQFTVGTATWYAKWQGQWAITSGQSLVITLPYDALYIYHAETGELLKKASITTQGGVVDV